MSMVKPLLWRHFAPVAEIHGDHSPAGWGEPLDQDHGIAVARQLLIMGQQA